MHEVKTLCFISRGLTKVWDAKMALGHRGMALMGVLQYELLVSRCCGLRSEFPF